MKKIETEVVTITPKMAAEWLTTSRSNRRLMPNVVTLYADVMRRKAWPINGETIKFDWNRIMIDGQHQIGRAHV
jgi:hypothetical protein